MSRQAELRDAPDDVLLARLRSLPRESAEHEAVCEILVTRYAGLVHRCARRYRGSPEPIEDLLQVGYVGLLKAINNFDPATGDSLSAYAIPCVSGEIKRHFRDRRWQIRVQRQDQELLLEMRVAEETLTQQLGRIPADIELAAHLGVSADDVRHARQAHQAFTAYSLDAPLSSRDSPALLGDMLGEDDPAVAHATDMEAVHAHLDDLPERQQRILMLRFYGNLTQEQIGDRLGISQMHVSRLLDRALTYLRTQITQSVLWRAGSTAAGKREREPHDAERADHEDSDQHRGHPAGDKTGHQQDGGRYGQADHGQPGDGHHVRRPHQALLLTAAEHQPVVGDRSQQQRRSQGGQDEVGQVQVSLAVAEPGEPVGEREREQEPEQDLYAQAGHAELLEQFGKITVVPFGLRFIPHIRGPHRRPPPVPPGYPG